MVRGMRDVAGIGIGVKIHQLTHKTVIPSVRADLLSNPVLTSHNPAKTAAMGPPSSAKNLIETVSLVILGSLPCS